MSEGIQHLTAAMAAGDAGAVDAFYRQYFGWMYAQARRVTKRDESFCLDVVQDAVLRVIRTVKPVDCESRFRGWLRLVVQTTAFDLLRREARRKNREAMVGASQLAVSSDSLQLDWLREQINRLDPELVNIVELRFEQDWTLRRIGEKLGLSIGAVDGRLRRALKNLKLAAEEAEAVAEPVVVEVPKPEVAKVPVAGPKLMEIEPDAEVDSGLVEAAETLAETPVELPALVAVANAVEPAVEVDSGSAEASASESQIEMPALVGAIELEPAGLVMAEPVPELGAAYSLKESREPSRLFEPVMDVVESSVAIEGPELIGLEDEAGAYDDRI